MVYLKKLYIYIYMYMHIHIYIYIYIYIQREREKERVSNKKMRYYISGTKLDETATIKPK